MSQRPAPGAPLCRSQVLRYTPRVDGVLVATMVGLHTFLLWLFFTPGFRDRFGLPLETVSHGLVPSSLLESTLQFLLVVGGLGFVLGRLRPRDVGLRWSTLPNGLLLTLLIWGSVQITMATLTVLSSTPPVLNPVWTLLHAPTVLGQAVFATIGNAFVEEILYRGFLFPQVYLLAGRMGIPSGGRRLIIALFVSQGVFGLNHFLAGKALGLTGGNLVLYLGQVTLVGIFFAVLYLQTQNLLIVVGVHGLINNPLSFFLSPLDPSFVTILFGLALMHFWPRFDSWCHSLRPRLGHFSSVRS